MMKEMLGRFLFTVLSFAVAIGVGYLIKRKIVDESFGFPWLPLAVLGFVSIILVALALISWWGAKFESESVVRDAELVSVESEGILQSANGELYFIGHLLADGKKAEPTK